MPKEVPVSLLHHLSHRALAAASRPSPFRALLHTLSAIQEAVKESVAMDQGQPFTEVPDGVVGFCYLISNLTTGQQYIGLKQFRSTRSRKVAGKKRRVRTTKESDWRTYFGSCKELKADLAALGTHNFKREILRLCTSKRELGYWEVKEQFDRNVLYAKLADGSRAFYNQNIMSRWFS